MSIPAVPRRRDVASRFSFAIVLSSLAGACANAPAVAGKPETVTHAVAGKPETVTYAVAGKAETVTYSCGTPPYYQPAHAVRIYRGGKRGDAMGEPPVHVAPVSRGRTYTARLPSGQYCLSSGDAPHVCDAELRIPDDAGSLQSIHVTHTVPNRTPCNYGAPAPSPKL